MFTKSNTSGTSTDKWELQGKPKIFPVLPPPRKELPSFLRSWKGWLVVKLIGYRHSNVGYTSLHHANWCLMM